MSKLIPKGDAKVVLGKGDKAYSNIRIRCGDRDVLFDPEHWPGLREELDQAYLEAVSKKNKLIIERTERWLKK